MNAKQITMELINLHRAYLNTRRAMVTEERYNGLVKSGILTEYNWDTEVLREPLIEHVGHSPIIASFLHQYIEHRDDVDLGRSLIMLSIHDIGETKVGDVQAYKKTESHETAERKATRSLLPEYLYRYFEEMEALKTYDAKFAKAVDSLAPILYEATMPEITPARLRHHNFTVDTIVDKKGPHFAWDAVLNEIFDYLIEKYRVMDGVS